MNDIVSMPQAAGSGPSGFVVPVTQCLHLGTVDLKQALVDEENEEIGGVGEGKSEGGGGVARQLGWWINKQT